MQTVKWLGFCLSNALTRTTVHFFPSAGTVTAPYPANFKLTLFSPEIGEKRVMLEGARLSNPDGVRIEEAFPVIATQDGGLYGLTIEVSSPEPRIDLSGSQVIVEFSSKGKTAKFIPRQFVLQSNAQLEDAQKVASPRVGAALKDAFQTSSLICINTSTSPLEPKVTCVPGKIPQLPVKKEGEAAECADLLQPVPLAPVPALSVSELSCDTLFDDSFAGGPQVHECSWGLLRTRTITVCEAQNPASGGIATYLLYRDALTRRPVSVQEL